jgi:hypothetical protein
MAGVSRHLRPVARLILALVLALGWVVAPSAPGAASPATAASLPEWTGGIDLYREGVFTTQQSWLWCTAAGIQIIDNIVDGEADHSTASQRTYFDWMRGRNRYDLPISAGVDPQGWTAGLRHFVDDRYRLVASASFDGALHLAVTRIRLTNLPVALTVSQGGHGWILNGFTATADPARTKDFQVTSVRVTGPLWGLQSRNGYDMRPNTKLTPAQLRTFFTPWRYAPLPMIWDGKYISIQPVPVAAAPAPSPSPPPPPAPSPSPSPLPTPSPIPSPDPSRSPDLSPVASQSPAAAAAASGGVTMSSGPTQRGEDVEATPPSGLVAAIALVGSVGVLFAIGIVLAARSGERGRRRQD